MTDALTRRRDLIDIVKDEYERCAANPSSRGVVMMVRIFWRFCRYGVSPFSELGAHTVLAAMQELEDEGKSPNVPAPKGAAR